MVPDLEYHGKVVKKYGGTGELVGEDLRMPASFQLAQYAHGKIYLRCAVSDPVVVRSQSLYDANYEPPPDLRFIGHTDQGYEIKATELVYTGTGSVHLPFVRDGKEPAEPAAVTWQYRCNATLKTAQTTPPAYVVFSLVNLTLLGAEWPIAVDGHHIVLRPVESLRKHNDVWRELSARGGRDVTYQAIVRMHPAATLQEMQKIVDNLCLLLTLARGTPITWISCEAYSETAELLTALHRDTFTKDYRSLDLFGVNEGQRIVEFVETAYPRLQDCREQWRIDEVIAAYVDSKSEQTASELRGLQLACCMEILKGKYLVRVGKTEIVPDAVFGRISKALAAVLRAFGGLLPDVLPKDKLDKMQEHLDALNRYSFRHAMTESCAEIGLFTEDPALLKQSIRKFKDMRNDLVHEGRFPAKHGDAYEQYKFMDEFVGRFLVAALGYPAPSLRPWTQTWTTVSSRGLGT